MLSCVYLLLLYSKWHYLTVTRQTLNTRVAFDILFIGKAFKAVEMQQLLKFFMHC